MEDLISIIIPVYNSEKYLADCLESVCNQTYKNLQIIVVDDCSTDNSGKICDEYAAKDERIEVYRPVKNGGQSASRNLGLKHAKGEWIAFADNDDTLEPEMLEVNLRNALNNKVLISGCANNRIENGNVKVCNINEAKSGMYGTEPLVKNILINPCDTWVEVWTKLYHKSLIKDLVFPEGCQLEDYMVNLPLLLKVKNVYFDNKPLYNWYIRNTSQSNQSFFENRLSYFEVTENLRQKFIENEAPNEIINAAYVWELGVKSKLLEDMCNTRDPKLISVAKEKLDSVKELVQYANKCSEFKLKSKLHIKYRFLKVRNS